MTELRIKINKTLTGITMISLAGTIDVYTSRSLENTFHALIKEHKNKFIIDLSEVSYLNSAGAGFFMEIHAVAQENKGKVVLTNLQSAVRDVFEALGLTQVLKITSDQTSAMAEFNQK